MVKRSKSSFRLLQVGEIDLHQLELRREALVLGLVGEPLERAAQLLLELCARHGIPHRIADITLAEVYRADEIFCTGTMGEIASVVRVDGGAVSIGAGVSSGSR